MFSSLNPLPQLPKYKGPYSVGSCEYEIPVSELASGAPTPDASITTIKFRVYYPTTSTAKSKTSIPWLPTPQKEGNRAYAKFLGLSERSSGILANLPSMLSYPTIPAVNNASLQQKSTSWPVAVFSHGLGGNYNTYSSFVGSLASCGVVVVAPEHRDQSAPISFVRSSQKGPGRPVPYRRLSHNPTVEVLNARNEMLRIRLWELERLYSAVSAINSGQQFTNLADATKEEMPSFNGKLDLTSSKVTWAGHSFGAATVVQFVKSVYYHQLAPSIDPERSDGWDHTPLYTPASNHELSKQITPDSPMILLDLWTMPLTSKSTQWLWEKPLPCYDRKASLGADPASNVVSIMSNQFYKWPELLNRTKAILSANPQSAYLKLSNKSNVQDSTEVEKVDAEEPSPQLSLDPITRLETSKTSGLSRISTSDQGNQDESQYDSPPPSSPSESSTRTPSPARSETSSAANSSTSSLPSQISLPSELTPNTKLSLPDLQENRTGPNPQLYLIPTSAHLSQSDFGVLFPNVTKYLLKTIEPSTIMELNVRAATAMMRANGIDVAMLDDWAVADIADKIESGKERKDRVLIPGAMDEEIWKRIDLST